MNDIELKAGIEAIRRIAGHLCRASSVPIAPPPPKPRRVGPVRARDSADVIGHSINGPLKTPTTGPMMPQPGARPATRTEVLCSVRAEDWHEPSPIRK